MVSLDFKRHKLVNNLKKNDNILPVMLKLGKLNKKTMHYQSNKQKGLNSVTCLRGGGGKKPKNFLFHTRNNNSKIQ